MAHIYKWSVNKIIRSVYTRINGTLWFVLILTTFTGVIGVDAQVQVCCPEFTLKDAREICAPEGACQGNNPAGGVGHTLVACKNTVHHYTVFPNLSGYIYTWTIAGGAAPGPAGNPMAIAWGSGSTGFIKVVISNTASGGSCVDSIIQQVCLIDGPDAGFIVDQDTVCINTPVSFTNTSLGGSNYHWDFGDGTTSALSTPPPHAYAAPGIYTVTLTATNTGGSSSQGEIKRPCGCQDTIMKVIVVLNGTGPAIDADCCFGTVCPGDTSTFCTSSVCTSYNWSVSGGTIVSGAGTSCIKVIWNATYTGPTTVSLSVPGCGSAPCPGTTTIQVPVLYPNLPVNGPAVLCAGASGSYFLPSMPGTYYLWTTTAPVGTYSFNDLNRNTAGVNISFTIPGTYQLQCQYNNPLAGCSGVSSITVNVLPVFSFSGDETVCEGSSSLYTANGNANWTVTPAGAIFTPGPGSVNTITWTSPGTYTIQAVPAVAGVFCNSSAVKIVQVVAKPVLGLITGPAVVCPGKNHVYKVTTNKPGNPFTWSVTGGTGSVMSQMGADGDSAIIKLNGSGPWTIQVIQQIEISPGVFCQSLPQTLTVTVFPVPVITSPANVCVDAVTAYSVAGTYPPGDLVWSVSPSNRGSILSGQGTNMVTIRWHGPPTTAVITAASCAGSGTFAVNIVNPPFVVPISANGPFEYCLPGMPNNLVLSTSTGFTFYQWYLNGSPIGGANSSSYSVPNATFTGAGIWYFSVEVSNGLCSVTKTAYVFIGNCQGGPPPNPIVCSIDFSVNPNPACAGQPVTFTAIPTGPGFSYQWSFGDGATSFQSPTQHEYSVPGNYTVTLTGTIGNCVATTTKTVTINPLPSCQIGASDTIFCPGGFVTLFGCPGFPTYQWYRNGNPITGANSVNYSATLHGEYELEVTNGFGCTNRSNVVYLYMYGIPKAKISGQGSICAYPGSYSQFTLTAFYNSAYKYDWSSTHPGTTFLPNNSNAAYQTTVSLTLPATLPYTAAFIVKVTDTVTGCIAYDTLCVIFNEIPMVTMPFHFGCEAGPVTLTPSPVDINKFNYQWSSGQTTPVITVSAPGFYSLTVTDKTTGCSSMVNAAMIYPKPDLSLFPTGCDTIGCKNDTLHLYIPLPLRASPPFNTYASAYPTINWYDNGNYVTPVGTGKDLYFVANSGGSHQISVVVTNQYGCTDTAGVFCLNVKCDTLDFGDAPDNPRSMMLYPTLLASNGARHVIVPGVFLGSMVDPEPDGQPGIGANCDDNDCVYPSAGDDEDGVLIPSTIMQGGTVSITVNASVAGFLDAWIDYNVDGDWSDPGEHVFIVQALTPGPNILNFTVPSSASMGQSYTRFRFRTMQTVINFDGLVLNGEVEDYPVFIEECPQGEEIDFGDAPDNIQSGFSYSTLLSSNGARHNIFTNIRLGALIDPETDGQPNLASTGDDLALSDDEDGVVIVGKMYVGKPANIQVSASTAGFLNAWMDFNKDGDWADAGEQIFINQPLNAGVNALTFAIPSTALQGKTYTRFRFNTTGGLSWSGPAVNGEVEDYRVHTCPKWWPIPTSYRHLIVIPHDIPLLTAGDVLGVFYHDADGMLVCGGLSEFNGTDDQTLIAYGDNPATPEKDGFVVGESIIWKLCSVVKGDANDVEVIYDKSYPNCNGTFVINGLSALTGLNGLHVYASAFPGSICEGETVQLTTDLAEPASGVTFSWTSQPAGFKSTAQSPMVNPVVTTSYFVEAYDGLFHAFDTVTVAVTQSNPIQDTIWLRNLTLLPGQNYCYNAYQTITTAGDPSQFTVQDGVEVQLIGGQRIVMLPGTKALPGSHFTARITATASFCCAIPSTPASHAASGSTSIEEDGLGHEFYRLYPNPTSGSFVIEMNDNRSEEMVTVTITNLLGSEIMKRSMPNLPRYKFDLSERQQGIYLVRITRGTQTAIIKVIRY